jgi:hypothetical protein
MEVRQQGVSEVTQRVGPGAVGVVAVAAYAQDLGALLLELGVSLVERGDVGGSTTCKVEDMKGEDYVFLVPELDKGDLLPRLIQEGKVRGRLAHFCWHGLLLV